jgi:AcrR family transcriptional regulator
METNRRKLKGPAREEQTRADILAATKRLVLEHGMHKVTMEDIASALGKKKSFLYYYYPGRTEVIHAVIEAEFTSMQRMVRDAVSPHKGALEQVRAFMLARIEVIRTMAARYGRSTIYSALQGVEPGTDLASLMELRQSFDREEGRFIAGLLRQGIREGVFRPLSGTVIDDMVHFLLSAMRGVELELMLGSESSPPSPRMGRVLDIFLRGLAA